MSYEIGKIIGLAERQIRGFKAIPRGLYGVPAEYQLANTRVGIAANDPFKERGSNLSADVFQRLVKGNF